MFEQEYIDHFCFSLCLGLVFILVGHHIAQSEWRIGCYILGAISLLCGLSGLGFALGYIINCYLKRFSK
jgi:hypothetical protein